MTQVISVGGALISVGEALPADVIRQTRYRAERVVRSLRGLCIFVLSDALPFDVILFLAPAFLLVPALLCFFSA